MTFFSKINTNTFVSPEQHITRSSQSTSVQTDPTIFPKINSNGKIDLVFVQGGKNDCYLLVSLLSLSKTTEGKKHIKTNLKKNADGSITVSFPGIKAINKKLKQTHHSERIPESYTITPEEVQKAHNYSYSHRLGGKNKEWEDDVILYELAFEKYRKHIIENRMFDYSQKYVGGNIGNATDLNPLNYGNCCDAMFLITGKMATEYIVSNRDTYFYANYENDNIELQTEKATKKHLNKILDRFMRNPDRYALCASTTDHGLQIVKVTETEVIIRDPQKSQNNEPISREEFLNNIYSITVWDSKKNTVSGILENIAGL